MFCPSCHDEFRPGFTACPDCMVDLVDALPDEDSEEGEDVHLTAIARFDSIEGAMLAKGTLDAAGIPAVVPEAPDGSFSMSRSSAARAPVPLMVPEEYRERAAQILERNGIDTSDPDGSRRELRLISRPAPGEYAAEASRYIDRIPDDGRVLAHMAESVLETEALALSIGDEALSRPYGPGKWTGKELLVHVSDDERIYAYRALRFARGDATELPGFEEKDYARTSRANERDLEDILRELAAVREATIELFDGLDDEALMRIGVANGHPMSVRAAAYHIAGHELHHVRFLREGYPETEP